MKQIVMNHLGRGRVENDIFTSALNHLVALFQLLKTQECASCAVPERDPKLLRPLNKGFCDGDHIQLIRTVTAAQSDKASICAGAAHVSPLSAESC